MFFRAKIHIFVHHLCTKRTTMNRLFPLLSLILLMVGCSTYKDVVYLQDVTDGETRPIGQVQEITIQPSDVLSISVNAAESEKELVLPFNITPVMTNTGTSLDDATETTPLYGYVVDPSGCINFPTFGKLHVAGMTRNELINFLSNKLIDEGQLTRPIVSVSFLTLKVNVLGEVNKPGTYSISSNKMTLLDAISMAGDLTIYGGALYVTGANNGIILYGLNGGKLTIYGGFLSAISTNTESDSSYRAIKLSSTSDYSLEGMLSESASTEATAASLEKLNREKLLDYDCVIIGDYVIIGGKIVRSGYSANGSNVYKGNMGTGYAYYYAGTLTVDQLRVVFGNAVGIQAFEDLTINMIGDSFITVTSGYNGLCVAGNLTLNLISHTVCVNDTHLHLTRTEFAILKLLMQNPGQVIAKSVLLDRISEDTPDCTESSLKVHISNLRQKLREADGQDHIEAVWGIGFRLVTEKS